MSSCVAASFHLCVEFQPTASHSINADVSPNTHELDDVGTIFMDSSEKEFSVKAALMYFSEDDILFNPLMGHF